MKQLKECVMSFDIETTGLDPQVCSVTCACAYAPEAGLKETFFGPDIPKLLDLMDRAHTLCAFNGARFDIPFLQTRCEIECSLVGVGPQARGRRYGIDDRRVGLWVLKLLDVYEGTHKAFGGAFPLNRLLQANGMESKTGTGGEAIELARAGRWEELGEYCMQVEWAFFYGTPPVLTAFGRTPSRPTRSAS